jgi:hypothetical protein
VAPDVSRPLRSASWVALGAAVLAAAIGCSVQVVEATRSMDEALPLVAAERVLAGEVPYRDYASSYPPFMTYVDARVLSVFPGSLLATRCVYMAILLVASVIVARVARLLSGSPRSGVALGALAATACGPLMWGHPIVPATAFVLAALLTILRVGDPDGARPGTWSAVSGLLLGAAALARHDMALAATPVLAAALLLRAPSAQRKRAGVAFLGGLALGPAIAAILLTRAGAAGDAWIQLVAIPAAHYARTRSLPWPLPWEGASGPIPSLFTIYGAPIVGLLVLARVALDGREGRPGDRVPALAAGALVLVLILPAWVRTDPVHMEGAGLVAAAAIGVLARGALDARRASLLGLAIVLMAPNGASRLAAAARTAGDVRRVGWSPLPTRRGILDIPDAARQHALALVATRPPGTRIFVGVPRHDQIYWNDVGFYFDAGALPATKHHELPPWDSSEYIQNEIVLDLERARPPFVVLVNTPPSTEPNDSARSSGSRVLDAYLASHYTSALQEGPYLVLARR